MALIQSATQVDVAGSSTTAPSIIINGVVGGNAIVGFASIYDGNTTWTLTDTTDGGNTFVTRQGKATHTPAGSAQRAVVAVAVNVTGGNRTVAFNLAGTLGGANRYYSLGCQEWSGVATSSPEDTFDVNEEIDTSGAVDISAGPITTTDIGDVLVGATTLISSDPTANFASPASWSNSYRQNDCGAFVGFDAGYWLPGSIQTTYTAQWAHDNNTDDKGAGVVVALKPAASGPTIINHPQDQARPVGSTATFSVVATEP